MKLEKGYWVDKNNNSWKVKRFSKEEAMRMSKSLIDCVDCVNCYNSIGSVDCKNSNSLIDCWNLKNSSYCIKCSFLEDAFNEINKG